jgi:hypothetical protein
MARPPEFVESNPVEPDCDGSKPVESDCGDPVGSAPGMLADWSPEALPEVLAEELPEALAEGACGGAPWGKACVAEASALG